MKKYVEIKNKDHKECSIIMLSTKEKTNIIFNESLKIIGDDKYFSKVAVKLNSYINYQNLYITSNDEIKEGDWVICSDYKNSYQVLGKVSHIGKPFNFKNTLQINGNKDLHINRHNLDYCRKIIATNDRKLTKSSDWVETDVQFTWECTNCGEWTELTEYRTCKCKPVAKLSKSFLKEFVTNPNQKWEIEYKSSYVKGHYSNNCSICGELFHNTDKLGFVCPEHYKLKLNQDNTVNITLAKEPKTKFNYDDITHAIAYGHNKAKQGLSHHQTLINYKEANNIKYVRGDTYSKEEVEEMLFNISTALCWDDKDPEELIEHCQDVISEIRNKINLNK